MKICRFDDDRLGLVKDDEILDVTAALEVLPAVRWPVPQGDLLITHLDQVLARVRELEAKAVKKSLSQVKLKVNGEIRQNANTRDLVYNVERLIEYASSFYTLLPGDIIFTGTPEGVGPVKPGDVISAEIQSVGKFDIRVAMEYAG